MSLEDFLPAVVNDGGMFSNPEFSQLRTVLDSANQWLMANPTARVLNCETLTIKGWNGNVYTFNSDISMSTNFYTQRQGNNSHTVTSIELKGLRLWYMSDNQGPAQQVSYTTLVPQLASDSSDVEYEDLDSTLRRYNDQVKYSESLSGFILNVETVVQRCGTSGKIDGERTCYQTKIYGVNIVRVWFLVGSQIVPEEIGCTDFVPEILEDGGGDTMTALSQKANKWLQQQAGMRFTNFEFMFFKQKKEIDSRRPRSRYYVCCDIIQFGRVWFAKPLENRQVPAPPLLTYMTFEPAKIAHGGARELKFESIPRLISRINPWIAQCGARLLAIQTIAIPCESTFSGTSSTAYPTEQAKFFYTRESKIHVRLFFDGEYRAPWPGIIPDPGPMEDHSCCMLM